MADESILYIFPINWQYSGTGQSRTLSAHMEHYCDHLVVVQDTHAEGKPERANDVVHNLSQVRG